MLVFREPWLVALGGARPSVRAASACGGSFSLELLVLRTLLGGSQTESTGRHGAGYTVRIAAHRCVDRVSFPLVFMGEVTNVFRSPRLVSARNRLTVLA